MRFLSLLSGVTLFQTSFSYAPTYADTIFSHYIAQKYDRIGAAYKSGLYPHTTEKNGVWSWTGADWWTSGFLPGAFYLLNERKNLCPNNKDLAAIDWLTYARHWRYDDLTNEFHWY